jgi:hypothetical protein
MEAFAQMVRAVEELRVVSLVNRVECHESAHALHVVFCVFLGLQLGLDTGNLLLASLDAFQLLQCRKPGYRYHQVDTFLVEVLNYMLT